MASKTTMREEKNIDSTKTGKASRKFFTHRHETALLPNLIEVQLNPYKWFLEKGLKELLKEVNPIRDFTGKNLELFFGDYFF
jgi:DNA-directed RNA polymerase subunit beta